MKSAARRFHEPDAPVCCPAEKCKTQTVHECRAEDLASVVHLCNILPIYFHARLHKVNTCPGSCRVLTGHATDTITERLNVGRVRSSRAAELASLTCRDGRRRGRFECLLDEQL